MPGKKVPTKQRGRNNRVLNWILNAFTVFFVIILVVGTAWFSLFMYGKISERQKHEKLEQAKIHAKEQELAANPPPSTLINMSSPETVRYAAKHGWIPCPGKCLKLATPGWDHKEVAGHSPDDIWFTFRYVGGWSAYSQQHIGHIIKQHYDQKAEDVGICPICNGTGWVRKQSGH